MSDGTRGFGRVSITLILGACSLVMAAACTSRRGTGGVGPTGGSLFSTCVSDADCDSGLACPATGEFEGICIQACAFDDDCQETLGADFFCFERACTFICGYRTGTCPSSVPVIDCPASMYCLDRSSFECADFCVVR
jgi:hypothetical protein